MLRIITTVLLCLVLFFGPFWLLFLMFFIGLLLFSNYWEGLLALLLSDLLFAVPLVHFEEFRFVSFAFGLVLLSVVEILKKKTRFNEAYAK